MENNIMLNIELLSSSNVGNNNNVIFDHIIYKWKYKL